MNLNGFIGPIGDDLPSLIPLVFALIVFFSTFNLALTIFDVKQRDFDADLVLVEISNNLKGTGVIANAQHFETLCNTLNVRGLKYYAAVVEIQDLALDSSAPRNFLLKLQRKAFTYQDSNETLECTNLSDPANEIPNQDRLRESGFNMVSRIYPVIVQTDYTSSEGIKVIKAEPKILALIVWRT